MALPSDLIDLLAEFAAEGVEYLLVGGHAVAIHGRPRFTKDVDLWVRDTPENLARVCNALRRFGAPTTVIEALPAAAPEDVVWMGRPPQRIDIVKWVPGGDFEGAYQRRMVLDDGGVPVNVVGLDDLLHIKGVSGRPQDLVDVELLQKVKRSRQ